MLYHYRTATGETCCRTDNTTHLCSACKARLAANDAVSGEVPPPPSVSDRIRAARGLPLVEKRSGQSVELDASMRVNAYGVPHPPSVTDAIVARRGASR